MRSRKALINTIASLLTQLVTIISGLIIPRLIIANFGSDVNGVVTSITQFLGYIVLLEAGVGGVTRAAIYKPLAQKDTKALSGIINATEVFFKKIAKVFIGYLSLVSLSYPFLVIDEFKYIFSFSLILIIGTSTFIQYYFGITYQILLQADQKLYINSFLLILSTILNVVLTILLINIGADIHIVKIFSSLVYIIRPLCLNLYVKRKYGLLKDSPPNNEAIKQRWDGLGHHIAFYLHRQTDIAVLTIFSNVKEVSVYSIYFMIVSAIQRFVNTFSVGLEAAFGNMIAKKEYASLERNFRIYNFISFTLTISLFTSTAILIIPFIKIYTNGIVDANYIRPLFGVVLIIAEAIYCIRLPYHSVVMAAGHFKQTKKAAYFEAFINVILSIILVNILGLLGIAIATFVAMSFRTIYYVIYVSINIVKDSVKDFIKRLIVGIFSITIISITHNLIPSNVNLSIISWINYAVIVTTISIIITVIVNISFFSDDFKNIINVLRRLMRNNR